MLIATQLLSSFSSAAAYQFISANLLTLTLAMMSSAMHLLLYVYAFIAPSHSYCQPRFFSAPKYAQFLYGNFHVFVLLLHLPPVRRQGLGHNSIAGAAHQVQ
jgi:hypothetical protein